MVVTSEFVDSLSRGRIPETENLREDGRRAARLRHLENFLNLRDGRHCSRQDAPPNSPQMSGTG
jgi:hypothetical protein